MTNNIEDIIIHNENKVKRKSVILADTAFTCGVSSARVNTIGEFSLIFVLNADGAFCPLFHLLKKLWRCLHIAKQEPQINEEIRDRELRVIGSDGTQLGIMSAADAQHIADEKNLDLVKIAPQAKPPVCKIMDYGKYRFEQAKREKEARKNQHTVEVKEIKRVMLRNKALGACMSGSGSAVFCIFNSAKKAEKCVEELKKTYPKTFLCEPVKEGCAVIEG